MPIIAGEGPFRDRMGKNAAAKMQIAVAAAQLISPGETILIDAGSTTLYFAEELTEISNLTVVTNSTKIARGQMICTGIYHLHRNSTTK